MAFTTKIFTIVLIVTLTVTYGVYEKSKINSLESAGQLVLKDLPDINLSSIYGGKKIKKEDLLGSDSKGLMVHFWGTWCAPCEAELPGFIKLAGRLEVLGIKFLLVAVNDDLKKIKKYLKRYKVLPNNIFMANDPKGEMMPVFGTAKVPETYLFSKAGKHLNKFVGPQEWEKPSYFDRVRRLVDESLNTPAKSIETH